MRYYSGSEPPKRWVQSPPRWGTTEIWRKDNYEATDGKEWTTLYEMADSGKWAIAINLGSGWWKREGWVNVDISPVHGPELICDISEGLPLADDSVDAVLAEHLFEHLPDTVLVMNEIWRVCKHGALVEIEVPHQDSLMAFADPTHKRYFNEETFKYFCVKGEHYHSHESYGIHCRFELLEERVYRHRRFGNVRVKLGALKN